MKTKIFLLLLSLLVSNVAMPITQAQEIPEEELNSILNDTTYYDPTSTACVPGSGAVQSSTANSIYVIGDSLTNGMRPHLNTLLSGRLSGEIEATDGINIQDSIPKVAFGSGTDAVLVGLGTNNFSESAATFKSRVQDMVSKIRTVKPGVPIYWINVYAPRSDIVANTDVINGALAEVANATPGFTIVDWKTEATTNSYTFPDQLHPAQYEQRAQFVVSKLPTGAGAAGPATTPTEGTFSATVWGAQKTMPVEWVPILAKAAVRFNMDPSLLAALLSIETGWSSPESFATNPRRNSATATGPFQFLDSTATEFMPAPDRHSNIQDASRYTSKVVKALNNGTDIEPDNSYIVDGNKDGIVDRATPEDAAFMAAAYLSHMGASVSTPLGTAGDYAVPKGARGDQLTVRIVGAYYNQGMYWSAPNATSKETLNAQARGNNDVAHYMDQMMEVTAAGRASGVFGDVGAIINSTSCTEGGSALPAGEGGFDLPGEGEFPMVYYSQLSSGDDDAVEDYFGGEDYGTGSIEDCGCGPTTVAMAVSTLTANKVTPKEVADWAVENNFQEENCGSKWFWNEAATQTQYGISARPVDGPAEIAAAMAQKGTLVIISVANFPLANSTEKGHISMIRKYENGTFYLADSFSEGWADVQDVSRNPYSEADISSIVAQAWAITAR